MEYELINPSDGYTFIAKDLEVATLTVFLLGAAYGAQEKNGNIVVPIFLFGGDPVDWYQKLFNRTPDEGLVERRLDVSESLASMMLGSFEDRRRYEAALEAITDDKKREEFIVKWQDGCSSLNDIGTYAHQLAKDIEREAISL